MGDKLKPGNIAPKSGQYQEKGPRGGFVTNNEITSTKGNPLPPTSKPGNSYILVDPTRHTNN